MKLRWFVFPLSCLGFYLLGNLLGELSSRETKQASSPKTSLSPATKLQKQVRESANNNIKDFDPYSNSKINEGLSASEAALLIEYGESAVSKMKTMTDLTLLARFDSEAKRKQSYLLEQMNDTPETSLNLIRDFLPEITIDAAKSDFIALALSLRIDRKRKVDFLVTVFDAALKRKVSNLDPEVPLSYLSDMAENDLVEQLRSRAQKQQNTKNGF